MTRTFGKTLNEIEKSKDRAFQIYLLLLSKKEYETLEYIEIAKRAITATEYFEQCLEKDLDSILKELEYLRTKNKELESTSKIVFDKKIPQYVFVNGVEYVEGRLEELADGYPIETILEELVNLRKENKQLKKELEK